MTTIFRWYNPKCLKITRKEYFFLQCNQSEKKSFSSKSYPYMSISMFNWFNRWYFFVWVLWRFIHPKPLRKTRFYDDHDQKLVISRKRFEFLEFKLDLYLECGHRAYFCLSWLSQGLKSQKMWENGNFQEKSRFWPTWSWDRALAYSCKKVRKASLWGYWMASKFKVLILFLKICNLVLIFLKNLSKNFIKDNQKSLFRWTLHFLFHYFFLYLQT